ncbi:MAG: hypothetical protein GF350_02775, partial [Chitinivibrionales bacterium]|nr:hypothetical protein [Chitinivibrionales bacterium]
AGTTNDCMLKLFLHGKALDKKSDELIGVFEDILTAPALTDRKLLRDLLYEMRNDYTASIINAGHSYAMTNAASGLCLSEWVSEQIDGISQLRFLNELVKNEAIDVLVNAMQQLHASLITRNSCRLSVTGDNPSSQASGLERLLEKLPSEIAHPVQTAWKPAQDLSGKGIEINASVNFVGQAWKLSSPGPQDVGLLHLLARNLSTGYLWDKVRVEGGAYGGMSVYSSSHPVFACGSYRDPNLAGTLTHFTDALRFVSSDLTQDQIDQSIIGTIGRIDKPKTPHSKGFSETIALLSGRTREYRQEVRDAVLSATQKDLHNISRGILEQKESAITVLGNATSFSEAEKEGITLFREPLLKNSSS